MCARRAQFDPQQFSLISKALADPKRFEMLQQISSATEAPTCTCVRDASGLSAATVSHHLKELETAGLITIEREGKFARITVRRDVLSAYAEHLKML